MSSLLEATRKRCERAVTEEVFPGAVFAWVTPTVVEIEAVGRHTYEPDAPLVTPESVYDVASLTKLIGPMSLAQQLIDEAVLSFSLRVGELLPEFATDEYKRAVTLRHLMTYTVDFQYDDAVRAHLWRGERGDPLPPAHFLKTLLSLPLRCPPGTSYQYSDITAIALTQLIERATGRSLPESCAERFLQPLGMHNATFTPEVISRERVVPTEVTAERGLVWGAVHDEKAAYLKTGGITAGSAGLFTTITDVARYLQMVIGSGVWEGRRYVSESLVKMWMTDLVPNIDAHTPLAWGDRFGQPGNPYHTQTYTDSLYEDYPGRLVTKGGFTGCFMAADLDRRCAVAVLSNTVHPRRPDDPRAFNAIKEEFVQSLANAT